MTQKPEKNLDQQQDRKFDKWWYLLVAVIAIILLLVFLKPEPYQRIILFVKNGIWTTISITLISFALVMVFGLFVALGRLSKNQLIKGIATVYVEIVRGIPMLVQLIFWYFAFPSLIQSIGESLGIDSFASYKANALAMAILGLTFGYSAYMSEVYRAGIQSISRGQMEAARSLGMTYFQAMRHVILPQAVQRILPPLGGQFISTIKDSAIVAVISIPELTFRGMELMAATYLTFETWITITGLYFVLTFGCSLAIRRLELGLRHPHPLREPFY